MHILPKTSSDDETRGSVQFYTRERMSGLTRLEALQQAASAFVDQVAAQEGDHRIALVGFEDDANYLTGRGESAFGVLLRDPANLRAESVP